MKIVFIPSLPYTYRDHKRLGVELFLEKGYDVEVMDIHKVLIPGYKEKVNIEYFTFEKHWEPNNIEEIVERCKKLSENDFIFFYINEVTILHKIQEKAKAKFITFIGGSIPISSVYCKKLLHYKLQFKNLIKNLLPKYKIKPFSTDYFISGSPKDELIFPYLINKNTKVYKSNSRDYNLCLKSEPFQTINKYCVFLDTDVIDASDYILSKEGKKDNLDNYLRKIISFFKLIEKKFMVSVIISAHPKSRIYKNKTELEGIKIVHGKSVELVQGSEFVINEGTTAISYAIFFQKPIIFFTFKEIDFFYEYTCTFAKELKKAIINIDKLDFDLFQKELLNFTYYDYYKNQYLTYFDAKQDTFEMVEKEIFQKNA